jgi:hypothetical protein
VSIVDRDPGDEQDEMSVGDIVGAALGFVRISGGRVSDVTFAGLSPGDIPSVTIRIEIGEPLTEASPRARRKAIADLLKSKGQP